LDDRRIRNVQKPWARINTNGKMLLRVVGNTSEEEGGLKKENGVTPKEEGGVGMLERRNSPPKCKKGRNWTRPWETKGLTQFFQTKLRSNK